jgi:hypothetical protein
MADARSRHLRDRARPRRPADRAGSWDLLGGLTLIAVAVYAVLWVASFGLTGASPWAVWTGPGAGSLLGGMAEVTVGVLGAAITVVSIIVELASNRYTPRITEVFLRDRANVAVLAFFVLTSVLVLWVDFALDAPGGPPRVMVLCAELLMTASLLGLLPYFAYVLTFLSPDQMVERLARGGARDLTSASQGAPGARASLVRRVDQIGDIALKSVENRDRSIASSAVHALDAVLVASGEAKAGLPAAWFEVREQLSDDPDFVSFHADVLDDVVARRTWLEMKVMLQLDGVFRSAVHEAREVAHLVGIVLRRTGLRAARAGDTEVLALSVRFLNTALRAAINAADVRTAYHLLTEYRQLVEGLVGTAYAEQVPALAQRMKGYGQLGFRARLGFVLETVAYDLCALVEHAWTSGAPEHEALLTILLDVDREPDGAAVQEASLRGVRKAQVKLATAYLSRGEEALARRIQRDMLAEDPARLRSIREELEAPRERLYWEISDRGVDFDWLDEARRAQLPVFFGWFGEGG